VEGKENGHLAAFKITQSYKLFSKWFHDKSLSRKAYLNALAKALDYGSRLVVGLYW
jgi:hypothetical protein